MTEREGNDWIRINEKRRDREREGVNEIRNLTVLLVTAAVSVQGAYQTFTA